MATYGTTFVVHPPVDACLHLLTLVSSRLKRAGRPPEATNAPPDARTYQPTPERPVESILGLAGFIFAPLGHGPWGFWPDSWYIIA